MNASMAYSSSRCRYTHPPLVVCRDKDLAVRTDTLEVVLGALEEEGSL